MSGTQRPDDPPAGEETQAFQQYYLAGGDQQPAGERGLLYRLFVGWWRKP